MLDDFQDFLEDTMAFPGDIVISGDLNVHFENSSYGYVIRFLDKLSFVSLTPTCSHTNSCIWSHIRPHYHAFR